MGLIHWLAVSVIVAATFHGVKSECTHSAFLVCRNIFPFDTAKPTEDLTQSDFDHNCANTKPFEDCVRSLRCTPQDSQFYGHYTKYLDTAEGYSYLCQPDTRTAFLANPTCLRTGFVHHNGDCQQTVAALQTNNQADRCRYVHDRAECASNWVLRTCGDAGVARVVRTVIVTAHNRQYEANYGCRIASVVSAKVTTAPVTTAGVSKLVVTTQAATEFTASSANRSQAKGAVSVKPVVSCQEQVVFDCPAYIQLRRNLSNLALHTLEPNLDGICGQAGALQACINKSRCSRIRNRGIRRTIEALDFLCQNKTKQAYQANFNCLANNVTKKNLTQCDKEGLLSTFGLRCDDHRKTEACMRAVYEAGCGAQAADFFLNVHRKVDDHPCSDAVRNTALNGGLIAIVAAFSIMLSLRRLSSAEIW